MRIDAPAKNKQILQMLFDFFKKTWSDDPRMGGEKFYKIYCYTIQLCSFDHFPTVVSDKEFSALQSPTLYRGVRDIEHHANLLCDFDYHFGEGICGYRNGIYASSDLFRALKYTVFHPEGEYSPMQNPVNIMTLKLADDCRIVDPDNLPNNEEARCIERFIEHSMDPQIDEFEKFLNFAPYMKAILMGYDAAFIRQNTYAIFNREKLVVNKSEFDRICALSRKYKGGVIDFEQKYQNNEFLNE